MSKIKRIINKEFDNHFLPFLWMHGEDKETIKTYLEEIANTGIKSICLESRPYEEFLKQKWWEDVSYIIEQCKLLEINIWILDDKHFPTGYAAGVIQEEYPHLEKQFLSMNSLDFVGPKKNAEIILKWLTLERPNIMNVGTESYTLKQSNEYDPSKIFGIYAAKKIGFNKIDEKTIIKIDWNKSEDTFFWDVPVGEWSIFAVFLTKKGGEQATQGYLNPLVKQSTEVLIQTVYEPHYRHFEKEFGDTISGFFSDEPRFGNTKGSNAIIGENEMPLPWCDNLSEMLANKLALSSDEMGLKLLLLFKGESDTAHEIRYQYMQLVSQLYSDNFSKVIGKWCEKHHVEYIGHVIEDNNAHARLGYGAGHFFRSMAGQHMAGLDVVLHQLVPGQNKNRFKSYTSNGWDGEFFTYGLAKLGSSLGQLDAQKKGRTMCEVYGAYGWSEGLRLMKWITDHMLVNGVNYFVPHAFSMKKFPDLDCPPHFYAHGNNIQFPFMKYLVEYSNKISYMLSGGKYKSSIGILYHAEAEWAGESMLFQKPAKVLSENQIGFNIISVDMLMNQTTVKKGKYIINEMDFSTVIVPYAEKLPYSLVMKLICLSKEKVQILFIDDFPSGIIEGNIADDVIEKLRDSCELCTLNNIEKKLYSNVDKLEVHEFIPHLRFYHYQNDNEEIFMLFNESMRVEINAFVKFPTNKELLMYNAIDDSITQPDFRNDKYHVLLDRGETIIFTTYPTNEVKINKNKQWIDNQLLNNQSWMVKVKQGFGLPNKKEFYFEKLEDLMKIKEFNNFSGELLYQTEFTTDQESILLTISDVSEIVTVYLNDKKINTLISYPYTFELSDYLKKGKNKLEISVINNLGRYMKDYLSQYLYLDPVGINGEVKLLGINKIKEKRE